MAPGYSTTNAWASGSGWGSHSYSAEYCADSLTNASGGGTISSTEAHTLSSLSIDESYTTEADEAYTTVSDPSGTLTTGSSYRVWSGSGDATYTSSGSGSTTLDTTAPDYTHASDSSWYDDTQSEDHYSDLDIWTTTYSSDGANDSSSTLDHHVWGNYAHDTGNAWEWTTNDNGTITDDSGGSSSSVSDSYDLEPENQGFGGDHYAAANGYYGLGGGDSGYQAATASSVNGPSGLPGLMNWGGVYGGYGWNYGAYGWGYGYGYYGWGYWYGWGAGATPVRLDLCLGCLFRIVACAGHGQASPVRARTDSRWWVEE